MRVRTLLVLGRVSNLPTVWSNLLCAVILCGKGSWEDLVILCMSVSCIYVGGMYLNDACDVCFDEKRNPERPIPSGQISARVVLLLSIGWFVLGLLVLTVFMPWRTVFWGVALVGLVVFYDVVHKKTSWGLLLMGGCRFILYPLVGSVFGMALAEVVLLAGVGMFFYIVGLSSVAKCACQTGVLKYLAALPILLSMVLIFLCDIGGDGFEFVIAVLLFVVWLVRSFSFLYGVKKVEVERAVEGFLAGIVLLDLLRVCSFLDVGLSLIAVFLGFFLMSLWAQRKIPAN